MDSESTRLRVMTGLHAGATAMLPDDGMSIVGSGTDCDVQLFDPNIAPRHLAISRSGETLTVRRMDGGCTLDGRHLSIGESLSIDPGDAVALGDSQVVIGIENTSTLSADRESVPADSGSRTKVLALCAVALVLVATAFSGVFATDARDRDPLAEVEAAIEAIDIDEPLQLTAGDDAIFVTGIVSEPSYPELQRALSDFDFPVVNSVQSSTLLMEQVRSVFRTNGYHAELRYRSGGVVQVENLDAANPNVQAVAQRVRSDVPLVVELEFSGVDREPPKDSVVYSTDPDKRLTTIVDGDIAYVATEDGGRYFVGGILPGGFVLKRITEDGIQVDDNGEIRWLKL